MDYKIYFEIQYSCIGYTIAIPEENTGALLYKFQLHYTSLAIFYAFFSKIVIWSILYKPIKILFHSFLLFWWMFLKNLFPFNSRRKNNQICFLLCRTQWSRIQNGLDTTCYLPVPLKAVAEIEFILQSQCQHVCCCVSSYVQVLIMKLQKRQKKN